MIILLSDTWKWQMIVKIVPFLYLCFQSKVRITNILIKRHWQKRDIHTIYIFIVFIQMLFKSTVICKDEKTRDRIPPVFIGLIFQQSLTIRYGYIHKYTMSLSFDDFTVRWRDKHSLMSFSTRCAERYLYIPVLINKLEEVIQVYWCISR